MITLTLKVLKSTDLQYTVYFPDGSHEIMFARRQVLEGEDVSTEDYPFTAVSVTPGVIILQNVTTPAVLPDAPEFSFED